MSRKAGAIGVAGELILEILNRTIGEGCIFTRRGMRKFAYELSLNGGQFNSALQLLTRKGFTKKIGDEEYEI
jgi:hypothetical protein